MSDINMKMRSGASITTTTPPPIFYQSRETLPAKDLEHSVESTIAKSKSIGTYLPPLAPQLPPFSKKTQPHQINTAYLLATIEDNVSFLRSKSLELSSDRLDQLSAISANGLSEYKKKSREIDQSKEEAASLAFGKKLLYLMNSGVSITSGIVTSNPLLVFAGIMTLMASSLAEAGIDKKITGSMALGSSAIGLIAGGLTMSNPENWMQSVSYGIRTGLGFLTGVSVIGSELKNSQRTRLEEAHGQFNHIFQKADTDTDNLATEMTEMIKHLEFAKKASNVLGKESDAAQRALSLGIPA